MNFTVRRFIRKHPFIFWYLVLCAFIACEQHAHADSFDCETDGSTNAVRGIYKACGVGEGKLESEARLNAVKNAKDEFMINCDLNCMSAYYVSFEPKRTSCKENPTGSWKCYHLAQYVLTVRKK